MSAIARLTAIRAANELALLLNGSVGGHVHSVFESAMNIQVGDELISLLAAGRSLYPRSILLAETVSFSGIGFTADSVAHIESRTIRIGGQVAVDVREAEFVSLLLRPCNSVIDSAAYEARLAVLADAISQAEGMTEGLAPVLCHLFCGIPFQAAHNVWSGFLVERISRLYGVLCRRDIYACLEMGRSIAGCGPGLTPSADDFLLGIFAALHGAVAAGKLDREVADGMCKNLSEGAIPQTNMISASFLKSGAQGRFGEKTLCLISGFFALDSQDADLMELAVQVCGSGATSGVDTLAGIWFGLAACARIDAKNMGYKIQNEV